MLAVWKISAASSAELRVLHRGVAVHHAPGGPRRRADAAGVAPRRPQRLLHVRGAC